MVKKKAPHLLAWLGILAHPIRTLSTGYKRKWKLDTYINELLAGYLGYDLQTRKTRFEDAMFTWGTTVGLPLVSMLITKVGINRYMPSWLKL